MEAGNPSKAQWQRALRRPGPARSCVRLRRRRPKGSSRAAQIRLRSGPGNRRRQGHDGSCDILLIRRSSELIKTFGTSPLKQTKQGCERPRLSGSGPRQDTFKCVGDKNPGANQAHHRCNHLDHCQTSFAPPRMRTRRRAGPHSQKHFATGTHNRRRLGIWRNRCTDLKRRYKNGCRLRAWPKSND